MSTVFYMNIFYFLGQVKREPQATPCQVSEISTSHHNQHHANGGGPADASLATALVKMEANTSPKSSDQGQHTNDSPNCLIKCQFFRTC